jgi:hypothetical protein
VIPAVCFGIVHVLLTCACQPRHVAVAGQRGACTLTPSPRSSARNELRLSCSTTTWRLGKVESSAHFRLGKSSFPLRILNRVPRAKHLPRRARERYAPSGPLRGPTRRRFGWQLRGLRGSAERRNSRRSGRWRRRFRWLTRRRRERWIASRPGRRRRAGAITLRRWGASRSERWLRDGGSRGCLEQRGVDGRRLRRGGHLRRREPGRGRRGCFRRRWIGGHFLRCRMAKPKRVRAMCDTDTTRLASVRGDLGLLR